LGEGRRRKQRARKSLIEPGGRKKIDSDGKGGGGSLKMKKRRIGHTSSGLGWGRERGGGERKGKKEGLGVRLSLWL